MIGLSELLIGLLAVLVIILYKSFAKKHSYWQSLGIPCLKPVPIFGNTLPAFLLQRQVAQVHGDACRKYPNAPLVGFYTFYKPQLIIQDVKIGEKVLIKDFAHFANRAPPVDRPEDSLENNLFGLTGAKWKAIRMKISPVFTTGKLKAMVGQIAQCGQNVIKYIDSSSTSDTKTDIDIRSLTEMFSFHVIGNTVFGIDSDELSKPNSKFQQMGSKIFARTLSQFVRFLVILTFPKLASLLKLKFIPDDVVKFFKSIIEGSLELRKNSNVSRNDFVHLFLQLQEKGKIDVNTWEPEDDYLKMKIDDGIKTETVELTNPLLMSQALVFFTAGFDATSNTMGFALFELSQNPDIQQKLRESINKSLALHNNQFTYEMIRDAPYVEYCMNETLRKYPQIPSIFRCCTKRYTFDGGITIEPNTSVFIPASIYHMDPSIYPEPEKFIPERWEPPINRPPCSFIPFGDGPRMCIAMRFAILEMKVGLAMLVKNYDITLSPKTKLPLQFDPIAFFLTSKDRLYFNLKKINS